MFNSTLSWLADGEGATGSPNAQTPDDQGVLNRPLKEIFENTQHLQQYTPATTKARDVSVNTQLNLLGTDEDTTIHLIGYTGAALNNGGNTSTISFTALTGLADGEGVRITHKSGNITEALVCELVDADFKDANNNTVTSIVIDYPYFDIFVFWDNDENVFRVMYLSAPNNFGSRRIFATHTDTIANLKYGHMYTFNTSTAVKASILPAPKLGSTIRIKDAAGTFYVNPLTLTLASGSAYYNDALITTLVLNEDDMDVVLIGVPENTVNATANTGVVWLVTIIFQSGAVLKTQSNIVRDRTIPNDDYHYAFIGPTVDGGVTLTIDPGATLRIL